MLARQPGGRVIGPDEGLAAGDMIDAVRLGHVIADRLQGRALGELIEGQLVGHAPIADGDTIVRIPQHRLADTVVESEHAGLALDHGRIGAPGDAIDRMIDRHIGGEDAVILGRAFEMHVAPEVEEDGAVERVGRPIQQPPGRLHALVDRLLESIHRVSPSHA